MPAAQQVLAAADEVLASMDSELEQFELEIAADEEALAAEQVAHAHAETQRAEELRALKAEVAAAKARKQQLRWLVGGMRVLCLAAVAVLMVPLVQTGLGQGKETGEDLVYGAPAAAPDLQKDRHQAEAWAWNEASVAVFAVVTMIGFLATFRVPQRVEQMGAWLWAFLTQQE
ncbi:hypothetical protein D9Q98_000105 [Chlorella vulgaris]|uniref:Uncharacterized protein n=1 Tax=Chlorella vulgaris TaxID=3077 RepID=A0A9D4TXR4_CHLVU|nr:hypothetical protein D9Q98_000105 [Chlorella vulgaris]